MRNRYTKKSWIRPKASRSIQRYLPFRIIFPITVRMRNRPVSIRQQGWPPA